MSHIRTPKLARPCSQRASTRLSTRTARACVVLAKAAEEPATPALDWVKPEFDLESFCLKKEIRKFSKATASAGSTTLPAEPEEAEVEVGFSFMAPLHRKPDFTTIRPFWHELL